MRSSAILLRRRLLQIAGQFPGLHLREMARQADISEALAGYHLPLLVEDGFLQVVEDGAFRRYYPIQPQPMSKQDRDTIAHLRQSVPLQIALHLLEQESASHGELTSQLGLSKSTVSYHIKKLVDAGSLALTPNGRYALKHPDKVRAILTRWEPPRDLTDRFDALWKRFFLRELGGRR